MLHPQRQVKDAQTLYTCLQFLPWSLRRFHTMLIISEKATTLYVRSAISDIRELLGPHGSLDVASLTWTTQEGTHLKSSSIKTARDKNNSGPIVCDNLMVHNVRSSHANSITTHAGERQPNEQIMIRLSSLCLTRGRSEEVASNYL